MVRPPPKRERTQKRTQVSVRGSTFAKLQAYARSHDTQAARVVDEIINRYLDEQERSS